MVKNGGGPGILSNIPSTLYRWIEECRVLDGPSVHDVIIGERLPSCIACLLPLPLQAKGIRRNRIFEETTRKHLYPEIISKSQELSSPSTYIGSCLPTRFLQADNSLKNSRKALIRKMYKGKTTREVKYTCIHELLACRVPCSSILDETCGIIVF